jgi:hypothetical protein
MTRCSPLERTLEAQRRRSLAQRRRQVPVVQQLLLVTATIRMVDTEAAAGIQ